MEEPSHHNHPAPFSLISYWLNHPNHQRILIFQSQSFRINWIRRNDTLSFSQLNCSHEFLKPFPPSPHLSFSPYDIFSIVVSWFCDLAPPKSSESPTQRIPNTYKKYWCQLKTIIVAFSFSDFSAFFKRKSTHLWVSKFHSHPPKICSPWTGWSGLDFLPSLFLNLVFCF